MAETYALLAFPLAITSPSVEVSPAVSMEDANAVQLNVVIMVVPGTNTLTIDIQGSNDLQNWAVISTWGSLGLGYIHGIKSTAIGWRYVRLRYTPSGGTTPFIFFAGLCTSFQ